MPTILRRLPFFDHPTALGLPSGPVLGILHHQIVVWVSLTRPETPELPPHARRFPAVLDTGFNDNFLIAEQQLIDWAGLHPQGMPVVGHLQAGGQPIPLRDADLWLHPNRPGARDELSGRPAFCLELDGGVAVWPAGRPGARRLPLLGLRGLHRAGLEVRIDGRRCRVTVRTARKFWFFG